MKWDENLTEQQILERAIQALIDSYALIKTSEEFWSRGTWIQKRMRNRRLKAQNAFLDKAEALIYIVQTREKK